MEEKYEVFEGDVRRLEGLISQLELWSDENTINHKKEEVRLVEYIEMHNNLESLKSELKSFIEQNKTDISLGEKISKMDAHIQSKLEAYKETEAVIHNWIREIKNVPLLIAKSPILKDNQQYIHHICG